jgi:peptide-methionine (S)-S-oxide reductase
MRSHRLILLAGLLIGLSYVWLRGGFIGVWPGDGEVSAAGMPAAGASLQTATFAGGCFWSVESDFDRVDGVVATTSGYTGGSSVNPTYEQVVRGGTGHVEAVDILFDPAVVSYEQLLDYYWSHVDPFVTHRQFCDVGDQYRPGIYVHTAAQRAAAEASRERTQAKFRDPVLVTIADAKPFYRAEDYHQDYYLKHPLQYRYYRWRCGRDARLSRIAAGAAQG